MINIGGEIEIDDGSGSISAQGIGGVILIEDGSGSITVRGVAGSVAIDDGSGGIDVSDVEKDLIIHGIRNLCCGRSSCAEPELCAGEPGVTG